MKRKMNDTVANITFKICNSRVLRNVKMLDEQKKI